MQVTEKHTAHEKDNGKRSNVVRIFVAIVLGLIGCTAIWITAPYSNEFIGGAGISDDYLPIVALFVILVIVFLVNPLLMIIRYRWRLTSRQLVIILAMLLMASVLPGQGLLGGLQHSLAQTCITISNEKQTADVYEKSNLRRSLFPDKIGYGENVHVSEYLRQELPRGESIPWKAWLPPLLSWAPMILFYGIMMTGLTQILIPQWRDNERLSFPLLEVYQPLVAAPQAVSSNGRDKVSCPSRFIVKSSISVLEPALPVSSCGYACNSLPGHYIRWE